MTEDNEMRKYFREMDDLFRSPGWKHIIEQLEELNLSWRDIDRLNSEQQLYTAKGALIVIGTLLSLQDVTNDTKEEYPDA